MTTSRADTLQDTQATEVVAVGRIVHVNPQYWEPEQRPVCQAAIVTGVNLAGVFAVKVIAHSDLKTNGRRWGDVNGNFTLDNPNWHWPRACK